MQTGVFWGCAPGGHPREFRGAGVFRKLSKFGDFFVFENQRILQQTVDFFEQKSGKIRVKIGVFRGFFGGFSGGKNAKLERKFSGDPRCFPARKFSPIFRKFFIKFSSKFSKKTEFLKIFKDDLTQKSTVSPDPRIFKNLKKSWFFREKKYFFPIRAGAPGVFFGGKSSKLEREPSSSPGEIFGGNFGKNGVFFGLFFEIFLLPNRTFLCVNWVFWDLKFFIFFEKNLSGNFGKFRGFFGEKIRFLNGNLRVHNFTKKGKKWRLFRRKFRKNHEKITKNHEKNGRKITIFYRCFRTESYDFNFLMKKIFFSRKKFVWKFAQNFRIYTFCKFRGFSGGAKPPWRSVNRGKIGGIFGGFRGVRRNPPGEKFGGFCQIWPIFARFLTDFPAFSSSESTAEQPPGPPQNPRDFPRCTPRGPRATPRVGKTAHFQGVKPQKAR